MAQLSKNQRKWLLSLHVIFSSIMLGGAVVFLILSITAANTQDASVLQACYTVMHVLAKTSVRASAIGALVSGILLSVLTHWGLFKFRWIIAKEILMAAAIMLGPIGMEGWTLKAVNMVNEQGVSAVDDPAFAANSELLWTGIVLQLASIVAMMLLSIFKPGGQRKSKSGSINNR